ncbi:MAG: vitamin B12-dependent ribonucleotide reductase, partial [Hyphomicrobiales bacterium]|nr:vitamin B12-dependent ribonucleotide reductase [Hyphomicrobiales bacterium]
KNATSTLDYVFRELAVSYMGRHDLAHVDTSNFSNTALGKGVEEGRAEAVSSGLTRGSKLKVIKTGEPKGSAAQSMPSLRTSGSSGTDVLGATVTALAANLNDEPNAFKRDLDPEFAPSAQPEEVTVELIQEVVSNNPFKNEARARSLMQGYTGNSCSECGNFTMVRNGTCEKCDTCGNTSGCS